MKLFTTISILLFVNLANAQVRTKIANYGVAKPSVNIQQRNIEAEQQVFAKRSNADEAWFYENANYGGRKFVLQRGSYTLKELGVDLNDFLSSAIVPSNLIVVAYTNDNFDGDWYILTPENSKNLNFENTMATKAYVNGWLVSGKVNINDAVSSIIIYNPEKDYASFSIAVERNEYYVDLNQFDKDKAYRAYPAPYINGVDGHNMADLGVLNDKITLVKLNNAQIFVQIYQDANFKGYQCVLKKNVRNYSLFNEISDLQWLDYISMSDCGTITSTLVRDRAWANRLSSFKVNIVPGKITEIIK